MMCKICVYTFQWTVAPPHCDSRVIDIHKWIAANHRCRVFSKKHHENNVEVLNTTCSTQAVARAARIPVTPQMNRVESSCSTNESSSWIVLLECPAQHKGSMNTYQSSKVESSWIELNESSWTCRSSNESRRIVLAPVWSLTGTL
jgi:hypothetical protein